MKELEAYRKIMSDLPEGIREAEAEAEKNDRVAAGVINGNETGMSASDKTAIYVRATGTKTGMTYTQNLEAKPRDVLLEALHNSEFVQEDRAERMNVAESNGKADDPREYEHVSFDLLLQKAADLEQQIKALVPEASHISVKVSENLRTTGIVNSLGLDKTFTKRIAEAELVLICEERVHRTLELETSAPEVEALPEEYFLEKVREWKKWETKPCAFASADLPAVIDGSVMCNILLTAWQMFSGGQYLHKSTPFYGKVGEKVGSELVNIVDLPMDTGSGYGRGFDCEGSPSQRVEVIKAGRLQALLHNLTTAEAMGTCSTGNAGRDVSLISDQTECRVIPTNFTLLPGRNKKQELLDQLEDGIYICESYDMFHSVNTASGDFSIPCQGIYYRGKKAVGKVTGITINGNLQELLHKIELVAEDKTTVSMVMSKSFAISAASVYVNSLRVTGGQS